MHPDTLGAGPLSILESHGCPVQKLISRGAWHLSILVEDVQVHLPYNALLSLTAASIALAIRDLRNRKSCSYRYLNNNDRSKIYSN